ncbi:hypothetical protein ETB97_001380 [Aspergillus alliaceus]|uniref:Adenosine deaminase domain-containing protein n=1 Tax=Petromyces alliaceus TaxID=209559 RepID=A0A8H6E5S8_PETAA|nr:hypothetical protein ETB97_001380 [Aspergillus burnettii]
MDPTKLVTAPFTKALPKIELHAHLSGSISRQCLHDLWLQKCTADPTFSLEDPLLAMPPGKVDYTLETFFNTFSNLTYHLLTDLPSIKYATTAVLTDFLRDGVKYLELRTIPRSTPGFTKEAYLSTILSTITAFQSANPALTTRLILSIDRGHHSAPDASAIVDLALSLKPLVVGVDIAGNPSKGDVAIFGPALAKAKAGGLGVTVHFGEVKTPAREGELETLLGFGPDRLGHVIHVGEDIKREITDDVGFFCSPVSNEYLIAAEHFDLTRADVVDICREGVRVIFGGEEEKKRLYRLLDEFEAGYRE